jgi:hypothetical protein
MSEPAMPTEPGGSREPRTPGGESERTSYITTPFVPQPGSAADERTVVQQLAQFVERQAKKAAPLARGYKLVREIGEGTFGTVWLAEDKAGVKVAIKFFAHGAGREWQQLQDEVRSLSQLEATAGIIPLKEVEPDADPPYFVMTFAENGSLAQKLDAGPLPLKEAVRYFRHIAEALAFVHAKGIRHCDLKPGNILLNQHGQPLIADFGQAHVSDDAVPSLGTFFYMAPEQAEYDASIPDTRWDVYSLGALIYAMLTGHAPRHDSTLSSELKRTVQLHHRLKIYRDRIRAMPPPKAHWSVPGMDRMLGDIVDRCLALEPHARFRDAGAVLDALETRKRQRRQRPLLALAALATIGGLALLTGAGIWLARSAVNDARETLRDQQLKSNQVTAQLAANVLEEKLRDRVEFLEGLATTGDGDQLATMIAAGSAARKATVGTQIAVPPEIEPLRNWLLDRYVARASRYFAALVVIDPEGYVLARAGKLGQDTATLAPATVEDRKRSYDRSYAWRNWFNGENDFYDEQDKPRPPTSQSLISQPYVGKYFTKGLTNINVVVPVRQGDKQVGLLLGNLQWEEFQRWLTEVPFSGGFAVVVNGLGQCLCHQAAEQVRPQPNQSATRYYAQTAIPRDTPTLLPDFTDPVTGGTYFAASAPFQPLKHRNKAWLVLVQHDPAAALAPVTELQQKLRRVGIWSLAIMTLTVGGLWGGLIWTLRREERLAHG